MRYVRLALFIVALCVFLLALEAALTLAGAPISLRDTRGAGQMGLLAITVAAIMLFVRYVGGINPFLFVWHYAANWRRALAGFATMALAAMLLAAVLTAVFIRLGWATWSPEHWAALGPKILAITLANLLAAIVLALTEELIFRGALMRYLRSDLTPANTVAAVLASALLFAVPHLIAFQKGADAVMPLMVGLFLLGVLLATTYVVTGSIACAIGLHFGLLGFKVILRETDIATFNGDVRTGPDFFVMMVVLTLLVVLLRRRLWARFAVEPAALLDEDVRAGRISSF